jgi:anaerobic ribonucleoside-triphosphate reductase activating protein
VSDGVEAIQVAGIIEDSIVDGPGIRFTVFVQGCPHKCEGCQNEHTWDFGGGITADMNKLANKILKSGTCRITFSGGEPFCSAGALVKLATKIKCERNVEIYTYTGYNLEELVGMAEDDKDVHSLLCETNYLVDGRFEKDNKSLDCFFRGSCNQRIFDISCYPNSKNFKQICRRDEL